MLISFHDLTHTDINHDINTFWCYALNLNRCRLDCGVYIYHFNGISFQLSFLYNLQSIIYLCSSLDETLGDYYYFNFETGETQWSHPLDKIYCEKVIEIRTNFSKQEDIGNEKIKPIRKQRTLDDKPSLIESNSQNNQTHEGLDIGDNQNYHEPLSCATKKQEETEMNLTPTKLVS